MEKERWARIDGYFGYQVSDQGRIRYVFGEKSTIIALGTTSGYKQVYLDGKREYVHRLVMNAFEPSAQHTKHVMHLNGNRGDNRFSNLQWASRSDVTKHAYELGGRVENVVNRKEIQIVETGEIFNSISDCAKHLGVTRTDISHCVNSSSRRKSCNGYHFVLI